MTEEEWQVCDNPWLMQDYYLSKLGGKFGTYRKNKLFAVACCRQWWGHLPIPELKRCLDVAESCAEGNAREADLLTAQLKLVGRFSATDGRERLKAFFEAVEDGSVVDLLLPFEGGYGYDTLYTWDESGFGKDDASFLRCIHGYPFRPVTFAPSWLTPTAVGVAGRMYDARDFAAMPILADALQDAGCEDADVLAHCRGGGPHVRGCWVVDGVLGKG